MRSNPAMRSNPVVALGLAVGLAVPAVAALAAAPASPAPASGSAGAVRPVLFDELFAAEPSVLAEAFASFTEEIDRLGRVIEQRRRELEGISTFSLDTALGEAQALRASIDRALAPLAREGDLAANVNRVIEWATDKRTLVTNDPNLLAPQRERLLAQWDDIYRELTANRAELIRVSDDLLGLLRAIRASEAYMSHLMLVDQGHNAVSIMRSLIQELDATADRLRERIHAIRPTPMM